MDSSDDFIPYSEDSFRTAEDADVPPRPNTGFSGYNGQQNVFQQPLPSYPYPSDRPPALPNHSIPTAEDATQHFGTQFASFHTAVDDQNIYPSTSGFPPLNQYSNANNLLQLRGQDPSTDMRRSRELLELANSDDFVGPQDSVQRPPNKRQKFADEAAYMPTECLEGQPPRTPQDLSYHATTLCCLWKCSNPSAECKLRQMERLSKLFKVPLDDIEYLLHSHYLPITVPSNSQVQHTSPREPTVDPVTIAACQLWKSRNPGETIPSEEHMLWLSLLFGVSEDAVSDWFKCNAFAVSRFVDSGFFSIAESRVPNEAAIQKTLEAAKVRLCRDRQQCKPVRGEHPVSLANLRKDHEEPFICIDCARTFRKMDSWKRHLKNNRLQRFWMCFVGACCERDVLETPARVWSRKNEAVKHMETKHATDHERERGIRDSQTSDNHRKTCLFRGCPEKFRSLDHWVEHVGEKLSERAWQGSHLRHEEVDDLQSSEESETSNSTSESDDSDAPGPNEHGTQDPGKGDGKPHHQPHGDSTGFRNCRMPVNGSNLAGTKHRAVTDYYTTIATRYCHQERFVDADQHFRASNSIQTHAIPPMTYSSTSLKPRKIVVLGSLGHGGRASVIELQISGSQATLACKTMEKVTVRQHLDFMREMKNMSRLHHDHIVQFVNGYVGTGSSAILMQPVANLNLAQFLATCTSDSTDQNNLWQWFTCLCSGLQHIHRQGISHQDIKPSNILVKDANVLFADFGASRCRDDDSFSTQSREFTRLYAAPEMFSGQREQASDVFSLGCVFLEMTTTLLSDVSLVRLRLLQSQVSNDPQAAAVWTTSWTKELSRPLNSPKLPARLHSLLWVCKEMTSWVPRQRPDAWTVEDEICPKLCPPCHHHETSMGSLKKALTWPLNLPSSHYSSSTGFHAMPHVSPIIQRNRQPSVESGTKRTTRPTSIIKTTTTKTDYLQICTRSWDTVKSTLTSTKYFKTREMIIEFEQYADNLEYLRVEGVSLRSPGVNTTYWIPSGVVAEFDALLTASKMQSLRI